MRWLKQSTSAVVPLGFMLDPADADTGKTALTIASTDIEILKAGGTSFTNPSAGATHIESGLYYFTITSGNTDTVGPLNIYVNHADALPVELECFVLPANVYDSLVGNDLLDVNTSQLGGTSQTGRDIGASVLVASSSVSSIVSGVVANDTVVLHSGQISDYEEPSQHDTTQIRWYNGDFESPVPIAGLVGHTLKIDNGSGGITFGRITAATIGVSGPSEDFVTLTTTAMDFAPDDDYYFYILREAPALATINGVVSSGTHGNAALKTLIDDVPTVAEFNARTLAAASYATAAGLDELAETASDINIEPVPASRTFVLTPTTTGLRSETTRTITINSDPNTWAIDFRNDAAANQKVYSVEAPTITSGTAGGLTFGTPYREGTQAKVRITAVTAGTYTVRVIVRYGSATGPVAVGYLTIKAA